MVATILTIVFSAIAAIATVYLASLEIKKKRKADLTIVVLSRSGGEEYLAIRNSGEADAKNISVVFPQNMEIRFDKDVLANAIVSKGQQLNISYHPIPSEKIFQCTLEWDDKMGHHKKLQSIQVL